MRSNLENVGKQLQVDEFHSHLTLVTESGQILSVPLGIDFHSPA